MTQQQISFQYRKRYGLHAMLEKALLISVQRSVSIPQAVWIACNEESPEAKHRKALVSIPQAVWIACNMDNLKSIMKLFIVSIPQAVWIACNR